MFNGITFNIKSHQSSLKLVNSLGCKLKIKTVCYNFVSQALFFKLVNADDQMLIVEYHV